MIWQIGADLRCAYTAQALRAHGLNVHTHRVPTLESEPLGQDISCLILPFPSLKGECLRESSIGVQEILPHLAQNARVYGGKLEPWREALHAHGIEIVDLYDTEPLTTANAAATAEGALALALTHSPCTVQGSDCLVTGAGRIGKLLAQKLHLLGARVTLTARKAADLAYAEALGLQAEPTGSYTRLSHYDMVFNTVPSEILTPAQLAALDARCLLFELASQDGFSAEACRALGLQRICARGLPGRFSPQTAGELYANSIMQREGWL